MEKSELYFKILNFKKKYSGISNFYSFEFLNNLNEYWEYNDSFIFSINDHEVYRLYFFAKNKSELSHILKLPKNNKYILEIITNNQYEYDNIFLDYKILSKLKKYINPNCKNIFDSEICNFFDSTIGIFPMVSDVEEINSLLWRTFNTEISHLLYIDELVEFIKNKEIMIYRNKNKITSVLQYKKLNKSFYINQIINNDEKKIVHALLLNAIKEYTNNGGEYLYSWIEETNIKSIKFHEKYNMYHCGIWNLIYIINNN